MRSIALCLVVAIALLQLAAAFLAPQPRQLAAQRACCTASRRHVEPLRAGGEEDDDDAGAMAEAKIVVSGQAYGGYFRAHARNEAHYMRRLSGALQEYPDRTEIIVEGKRSAIDSFVRWCRKGPGLSQQISTVEVTFSEHTGIFDGFRVIPDPSKAGPAAPVTKSAGLP
ncbi:hypothetical protein JKP88DRAFT_349786 [Tribonema minus]|uniref:Acylphosphatase-like domain-containing protein n=1 Tax=Tribonema minus TaxID=303371 RepID=A0A835YRR3_9STRA|nr:hypothetical protein JKP88DRAFT_349786 [Tribonema minus]